MIAFAHDISPAPPLRRAPNPALRAIAQVYNRRFGLPPISENHYVRIDEAVARIVADAYDALPIVDTRPIVAAAYQAFSREIVQQWSYLTREYGYVLEPWTQAGQPYRDSHEMTEDVRQNQHLFFFTGGELHPFLSNVDPQTGLTANDAFRGVHDLFGHAAEGYGFGPRGEENAWLKHSQTFSSLAQWAMTTETRGQSLWFNFGRHNYDANGHYRVVPFDQKPFAQQKAALLPRALCDWQAVLQRHSDRNAAQLRCATTSPGESL